MTREGAQDAYERVMGWPSTSCVAVGCKKPVKVVASFQSLGVATRFAIRLYVCEEHSLKAQIAAKAMPLTADAWTTHIEPKS